MSEEPRPYTLVAELTYRCPLRCVYCSNPTDWNRHADAIKAANPATASLTSKALETWNFGTLHQRLDLSTWSTIFDRVHFFGFPSFSVFLLPFVLIVLKAPRTRPFSRQNGWRRLTPASSGR